MKLVLAALVSLAAVPAADADCGVPKWLGTPSGSTIPEHGSLYLFAESYRDRESSLVDADWVEFSDRVPHPWKMTRISDTVVRIDYAAGLATTVTAQVTWQTMTYAIDPGWMPPANAPRVIQYWHHQSEWSCSHADSWMIQVDQPTAAFRVKFTDDLGTSVEYIEPAQPGDDGRSVLEIGKHDCVAFPAISPEALAAGGMLELTAIRFDGSEVKVLGVPRFMRTSDLRTSSAGIQDAIGYAPLPAPIVAPPVVTNATSGDAFLVIAGGGVGLLFIGMLLVGRKRTPTAVQM